MFQDGYKIMALNTLLLIDDDRAIRHMLRESLEQENFLILEASHGRRSLEILRQHSVDLILLDLGLPDANGLDFIGQIRNFTNVPLIIVSGDHTCSNKVKGFETGADDFVAKPFDVIELVARIKAHLRRSQVTHSNQNARPAGREKPLIKFGDWTMDRGKFQIFDQANMPCDLTPREFQLLEALILNQNKVLRREDLCEAIREEKYIPTPRAIDVKITRIRKKIGDDAADPKIIRTIRGVGYIFDAETSLAE